MNDARPTFDGEVKSDGDRGWGIGGGVASRHSTIGLPENGVRPRGLKVWVGWRTGRWTTGAENIQLNVECRDTTPATVWNQRPSGILQTQNNLSRRHQPGFPRALSRIREPGAARAGA